MLVRKCAKAGRAPGSRVERPSQSNLGDELFDHKVPSSVNHPPLCSGCGLPPRPPPPDLGGGGGRKNIPRPAKSPKSGWEALPTRLEGKV